MFYEWRRAKADGNTAAALKHSQDLLKLQTEAGKYAVGNEYGARFNQAGSLGLNASTSHDATKYHVSLPSNKLPLWFALEAERFQVRLDHYLYVRWWDQCILRGLSCIFSTLCLSSLAQDQSMTSILDDDSPQTCQFGLT